MSYPKHKSYLISKDKSMQATGKPQCRTCGFNGVLEAIHLPSTGHFVASIKSSKDCGKLIYIQQQVPPVAYRPEHLQSNDRGFGG